MAGQDRISHKSLCTTSVSHLEPVHKEIYAALKIPTELIKLQTAHETTTE